MKRNCRFRYLCPQQAAVSIICILSYLLYKEYIVRSYYLCTAHISAFGCYSYMMHHHSNISGPLFLLSIIWAQVARYLPITPAVMPCHSNSKVSVYLRKMETVTRRIKGAAFSYLDCAEMRSLQIDACGMSQGQSWAIHGTPCMLPRLRGESPSRNSHGIPRTPTGGPWGVSL